MEHKVSTAFLTWAVEDAGPYKQNRNKACELWAGEENRAQQARSDKRKDYVT